MRRCHRLLPPPAAHVMYHRAAVAERRSVELANERHSRRIRRLGREVAKEIERIADERSSA